MMKKRMNRLLALSIAIMLAESACICAFAWTDTRTFDVYGTEVTGEYLLYNLERGHAE